MSTILLVCFLLVCFVTVLQDMLNIKALLRSLGEKYLDKADFDLKDYGDRGGSYAPK